MDSGISVLFFILLFLNLGGQMLCVFMLSDKPVLMFRFRSISNMITSDTIVSD